MSNDQWEQVYGRVAELVHLHRTTLVFVNTRRMAERAARHLGERLGKEAVAAHHGSLAKEARLDAEQRLKRGELKVLVATASLELGLDIGDVDLVCQLGSPRSIATFLQRAGRSGHAVGGVPKARLFPQSRDELVECAALLDAVRRGELDALRIVPAPLDVLAQQIVAETASREWNEDALFALVRRAWPYAQLARADFDAVVRMLADGFTTRHGPRASYVHRDVVHHVLRETKGARLAALTSGGTIPESGDYAVVLEPQSANVGTVNEDFAVESIAGDVFQLGNTSYRILRVEPGRVRVEDAHGAAPSIPFWLGEAPGRSDELSFAVARLRDEVGARIARDGRDAAIAALRADDRPRRRGGAPDRRPPRARARRPRRAADAGADRHRALLRRLGRHAARRPFAVRQPPQSRLGPGAAGSASAAASTSRSRRRRPRTRSSCRSRPATASRSTRCRATCTRRPRSTSSCRRCSTRRSSPCAGAGTRRRRWRCRASAGGRKVAPQLQRMKSEDLLAAVFPDQVACAENLAGDREVPEHPLVAQTMRDCLDDAMDATGWLALLRRIESGAVEVIARDLPAPSPLAAEALSARPYAFLDDAPIEERRTQAVQNRRYADPESADELGQLDADAIASVRDEAWPRARNADEMHEALVALGVVADGEAAANAGWSRLARRARRGGSRDATRGRRDRPAPSSACGSPPSDWRRCATSIPMRSCSPSSTRRPNAPKASRRATRRCASCCARASAASARRRPSRSLRRSALARGEVELALLALQAEGYVLQGRFTPLLPADADAEWCERHLLARIHRYTLKRLRREIEPVEPRDFVRFLFDWQRVGATSRVSGPDALAGVLGQLEGFEAPAAVWEAEILPARVQDYASPWLDDLCTAGRTLWTRLRPLASEGRAAGASLRSTPVLLLPRRAAPLWTRLAPSRADDAELGSRARLVAEHLARARRVVLRRDRRRGPPAAGRARGRARRARRSRPRQLRQLRRPARAARSGGQAIVGARAPAPRRHADSASPTRAAGR